MATVERAPRMCISELQSAAMRNELLPGRGKRQKTEKIPINNAVAEYLNLRFRTQ